MTLPESEILAPAGTNASFLAAIAAGADAIYCGLKHFSARMTAANFTLDELGKRVQLAHQKNIRVYVALNALVKSDELPQVLDIISRLEKEVHPDALIFQDPAIIALSRQAGFSGQLHVSTLANISFPAALNVLSGLGAHRVVLPRELGIDEIRHLARTCPPGLELETFIHGALCYAVSGRCYWSSFLGGRSGVRGRCVQPCRRRFVQADAARRFFSCQDLSVDVLVKVLKTVPAVRTWKIEGRKKGPHYVYYTVKAYQLLRDEGHDPKARKAALGLLERSLGRTATHYNFLPQRPQMPILSGRQTASGLCLGTVKGAARQPYFQPREALMAGDSLRIGYEDEAGHRVLGVRRHVPKNAKYTLPAGGKYKIVKGTPVFLTDRREPALNERIRCLETELAGLPLCPAQKFEPGLKLPRPAPSSRRLLEMHVERSGRKKKSARAAAYWLKLGVDASPAPGPFSRRAPVWWWLPPVIWPEEQAACQNRINDLLQKKERLFVLNAPWQIGLFPEKRKDLTFWAGPFCNLANPLALSVLKRLGFHGAILSPELGRRDYLALPRQSPLPLGLVVSGLWPLCISRTFSPDLDLSKTFTSPKGEAAFTLKHDDLYWTYPNWQLDLTAHLTDLKKAGFQCFVTLHEPMPRDVFLKKRQGLWNWKLGLQ